MEGSFLFRLSAWIQGEHILSSSFLLPTKVNYAPPPIFPVKEEGKEEEEVVGLLV